MAIARRILERLSGAGARTVIPGLQGAMRAHVAAELIAAGKVPIIIAEDTGDAEALYRDLAFLTGLTDEVGADHGLLFLGVEEHSPYEEYSPDTIATMERINTLYRIAHDPSGIKAIVTTPGALCRKHVSPAFLNLASEYLIAEDELNREHLLSRLVSSGYNQVNIVEDPGTFSVRGGIIDVFSPHRLRPIRIDLFGDTIESLRLFDPATQRTERQVDDALLLPAREIAFSDAVIAHAKATIEEIADEHLIPSRRLHTALEDIENQIHFFGIESLLPIFHPAGLVSADAYFPAGDRFVYMLVEPESFIRTVEDLWQEAVSGYGRAAEHHQIAVPPSEHLADGTKVLDDLTQQAPIIELPEIAVSGPDTLPLRYDTTDGIRSEILTATRSRTNDDNILAPLLDRLRSWRGDGLTNLIVCHTRGQLERVRSLLENKPINVRMYDGRFSLPEFIAAKGDDAPARGQQNLRDRTVHGWLVRGELSSGYVLPSSHLAVLSEEEIFGKRIKQRKRRRKAAAGEFVSDLKDLAPGDFVVHVDFGIGKYHGLTKLAVNGVESDYLNIEYKGQDKLYLPVHRLRLVSKYVSASEGRAPGLDRLGAQTWATTKRKVKDTLLKMAAELLRLYAVRASLEGFAVHPPDAMFRQFEAEFAFEPTPDQATAIKESIADVQKIQPMDRLICGDVGYGKTEVAMRAAMLTVLSKKQVAILVPTTVLAAQHFNVFSERFKNFPVRIGIMSRFQDKDQTKQVRDGIKDGVIDIAIGTHRLLGKQVQFKDLGLLIIDEEHRFGVAHKERMKKYRAQVHVLAMSATPIPRTLHMGFMGVRDMSLIATPPTDRLAVRTEVHRFSEDVIRDAIVREIRRGGQCFVVHNRVASIDAFARMLRRLVPEARVVVGHGQMSESQLERVMVDFMNKTYNVLLSTTIIESGIDIPNANTIIVNRADRMGLAQLYQLRGRVGRSRVRGFAHFLIPAGNLSKNARSRIAVLQKFTELGAGFKVASKDLEIRGAGNILGKQQSGTIAKVGFEMYQALLQEAIAELKGSTRKSLREPEINVPVVSLIPDVFIPQPGERLAFYQRFNNAETDEDTYDILQEITDVHGTPPAEVENLAQVMLIKQRLERVAALGLDFGAKTKTMPPRIVIRFDAEAPVLEPADLVKYVQRNRNTHKMTPDGRMMVFLAPYEEAREILDQTKEILSALNRLKFSA